MNVSHPKQYLYNLRKKENSWRLAWSQRTFRKKMALGIAFNIPVLIFFPFFFQYIEQRPGTRLHDILLDQIRTSNVSYIIFFMIWSVALLTLIRAASQPRIFITFIYSFFFSAFSQILPFIFLLLPPPKLTFPLFIPLFIHFYRYHF